MEKKYVSPLMEITEFEMEDVITSSGGGTKQFADEDDLDGETIDAPTFAP